MCSALPNKGCHSGGSEVGAQSAEALAQGTVHPGIAGVAKTDHHSALYCLRSIEANLEWAAPSAWE